MGAVLREQNALPPHEIVTYYCTAKNALDNGGAERAAKSAIPGRSFFAIPSHAPYCLNHGKNREAPGFEMNPQV